MSSVCVGKKLIYIDYNHYFKTKASIKSTNRFSKFACLYHNFNTV